MFCFLYIWKTIYFVLPDSEEFNFTCIFRLDFFFFLPDGLLFICYILQGFVPAEVVFIWFDIQQSK